jgi:hypothetical protein
MSAVSGGVAHSPEGNGLAIAGFVTGLLGFLFAIVPLILIWASFPLAVLGIVFGAIGWRRGAAGAPHKGLGLAGLILGVLGVVAPALWIVVGLAA